MPKSQQSLNSAILVAVISGLIILYILFLPAEQKRELLEENGNNFDDNNGVSKKKLTVLLSENVNEVLTHIKKIDDRLLPNILLSETTNAKVLDRINPFSIRNGWFDKKNKIVRFKIQEPQKIDNLLLSFLATKRNGLLTIKLNDEIIYESTPKKSNVVIELEKNILSNDNTLEFSVSSVGISFWRTNEYIFEDIKIVGDVKDGEKAESKNILELSEEEFINLDKAILKFTPFCRDVSNLGNLNVLVNNQNVYSALPVCDDVAQTPILSALREGQNEVIFSSAGGKYSIEQVRVDLELKEPRVLTFFFEVSQEQLSDIKNNKKNANLTMEFIDDDKNKKAEISLNGHLIRIDQTKPRFNVLINEKVREGNNYIEIRPKSILKIVTLKVLLI